MPSVRRFGYENNPQSLILISAESLLGKISRSDKLYLPVNNSVPFSIPKLSLRQTLETWTVHSCDSLPLMLTQSSLLIVFSNGQREGKLHWTAAQGERPGKASNDSNPSRKSLFRIRIRIVTLSSKNNKKNLYFYCLVTSLWPFVFEKWCKCTFKKY